MKERERWRFFRVEERLTQIKRMAMGWKRMLKCVCQKKLAFVLSCFWKILLTEARRAWKRISCIWHKTNTQPSPSPLPLALPSPTTSNHIFIDIDASFVSIYYLRASPIENVRIELGGPYCNGACVYTVYCISYKDISIDCDQHENEIIICCPKIISFFPPPLRPWFFSIYVVVRTLYVTKGTKKLID